MSAKSNSQNSTLIKTKDIEVKNFSISNPDGNEFYGIVGYLNTIIPGFKSAICATVVAFNSIPGSVIPYFYLQQERLALYLFSNMDGTANLYRSPGLPIAIYIHSPFYWITSIKWKSNLDCIYTVVYTK